METYEAQVQRFVDEIQEEPLVKKYLYRHTWLSGSSTYVSPITVWKNEVVLQWDSDKRIFDRFIDRIVEKYNNLFSYGYFRKSDGSCPSTIVFRFKNNIVLG